MRRRILISMVSVVVLATLVLTLPLTVVLVRRQQAEAIVRLERAAERTAAKLEPNVGKPDSTIELPDESGNIAIAVYDRNGDRIFGDGPNPGDPIIHRKAISAVTDTTGGDRVLAQPVIQDGVRVATIRVSERLSQGTRRIRNDLLWLLGVDLAAIIAAVAVGAVVSTRLTRPLRAVRDDAVRLGGGDFSIRERTSGVTEVDETSQALAETASRLEAVLQRERTFSANASHQLRTPLTSMRLAVESELETPRPDPEAVLGEVLDDLDRLETTIATLLAVARDLPREYEPVDLAAIKARVEDRWGQAFVDQHRTLRVHSSDLPPIRVSVDVLDEILDVLIDNALKHGSGVIEVSVDGLDAAHLAVTVADEGTLATDPSLHFQRRPPGVRRPDHGLGLALARSLAEAEGGRLVLIGSAPTTFRLLLPDRI